MSEFLNQINNINRKLFFKFSKIKVVPDEETKETKTIGELTGGMGFSQHYGGNSFSSFSHDTRNAGQNDKPYTTHKAHTIRPDHAVKQRPEEECPDDDPSCKDAEDDNSGIVIDLSKAKEGLNNTSEGKLQELFRKAVKPRKLKPNQIAVKVDGVTIPLGGGPRKPETRDKQYFIKNYPKWKKDVEKHPRVRTKVYPLAADFGHTYLYIYFGIDGLSSRNALEVLIKHDTEKLYDIDWMSRDELQLEQDEVSEAMPEEPTATEGPPPDDMAGVDDMGDMGAEGDPAMGDMSDPGLGDPNAAMPGEEPPKDPSELGRTYEMKKIYARLVSMNEYLSDEMSPKIMKTKTNIAKAIDLFAVIGANPDSYKDRIDEIIISYYKFLEAAYRRVRAFYKSEAKEAGGIPLEKNEEQKDESTMEVTL